MALHDDGEGRSHSGPNGGQQGGGQQGGGQSGVTRSGRARSRAGATYAAIDLGTNNCRLLIAEMVEGGFRVVDAFSRIVRLGEGLQTSHRLSDQAIERTMTALRICGAKIRRRSVRQVRAVATEACRRAENCEAFVAEVTHQTGLTLEIISAQEEGRLALTGCAPLLNITVPYAIVFDIGGGSTELMWMSVDVDGPRILDQMSVQSGVITLAERYGGDLVSPDTYRAMVEEVNGAIAAFEARNRIRQKVDFGLVQMLGTSGTVTTLAGVHMGLHRYERRLVDGCHLRLTDALAVVDQLTSLDFNGRAANPCIGIERADLVVAGCAVFQAIVERWPVPILRIADRGLREGILVDLMGRGLNWSSC